jgi:general nucleoside transport system permease protein
MITDILFSTLRLSVPILFAAFGGMLSERSGVANIALEAVLLFSAFAAAAVTAATGSVIVGSVAGLAGGALISFLFGASCIWGRGDQIVIGTAFNLLAIGLIPVLCKAFYDVTGSTPALDRNLTFHHSGVFFALTVVMLGLFLFLFARTRHGLRLVAAGENPGALVTQGVNFRWVRLRAVVEGGVVVGFGGIYLSLCQGSGYVREMSAGRGFIALAALIFGAWRPIPTFLACLFFAFTDAVQIQLQGKQIGNWTVPNQFVQILPYVVTLLVLAFYNRKIVAPAAINRDFAG